MLSCLLLLLCQSINGVPESSDRIAAIPGPVVSIIIDDLGYNLRAGKQALALSQSITVSILPGRPHTQSLALLAVQSGNEVMVHLPMQSIHRHKSLGFAGLTDNLSKDEFDRRIDQALRAVPYARGVNNHMGSLLTGKTQQMSWLMRAMTERYRDYYFVDSKTTPRSVAEIEANNHYIPTIGRDVFLDDVRDPVHIEHQLDQLIAIAKRKGYAVAIAHPYRETLSVLSRRLPLMQRGGVKLIAVSELIHFKETPSSWLVSSSR